jgi:hypothetical protein
MIDYKNEHLGVTKYVYCPIFKINGKLFRKRME